MMADLNSVSSIALKAYIRSARKLSIYGGESGWSENNWFTTRHRKPVSMSFCELGNRGRIKSALMQNPFRDFAKAYVRHKQYPKEVSSISSTMWALRFLYAGLMEVHGEPDILRIDGAVQESVRGKVDAWYAPSSKMPYVVGCALMPIYSEVREKGINPALPHWQLPWKKRLDRARSMHPKAIIWRRDKTPDDQKFAAVFVAFELAESEKDQYWSSLAVLLAFASSRGGELVDLSIDSLIDEDYTDKYGRTKRRVGLRWFSEKGFNSTIKWVPRLPSSNGDEVRETQLILLVVEAFNRLMRLSKPSRNAAKLAYDTDGTFYPVHKDCVTPPDYPQDVVLTDVEVAQAMRRKSTLKRSGDQFYEAYRTNRTKFAWHFPCIEHGNPAYTDIAKADYTYFSGKIKNWPHTSSSERVKVWESLVLHQWNQFNEHPDRALYPNSYCLPSTTKLSDQLGGRWHNGEQLMSSMFDRLGLTMEDGSPVQLTSHDFRRWHGTRGRALAYKGLSEHRLRMLAGRKDIRQNDAYDLNTPEQKAALYRQIIPISCDADSLNKRREIGDPIYRHELLNRPLGEHEVLQPVQVGEFGACTHSLTEPPCMKGGDCMTCSEKKYIKGTPGCLERLRATAAHHKAEFDALDEHQKKWDQLGVDQWMTYHAIRYAVAECLVRQMEDHSIPDGTVLGLDERFDPSPLAVNLMAKGIEVPNNSQDPVAQEINQLLGPADA